VIKIKGEENKKREKVKKIKKSKKEKNKTGGFRLPRKPPSKGSKTTPGL
jgi:hypothetical protein